MGGERARVCLWYNQIGPPLSSIQAAPILTRDIETTTLSNGIRVITEAMPHVRSVSVGFWIGSGSRDETPEVNGISHFIEHMLFKGTATRSAEDIARSVDSIGGNLDAFTSKELVCYNTKVLDEHLGRIFALLADLILRPAFREEDIAREKGVILEEIKMDSDNPDYLANEIFCSNFWKGNSLGRAILGTPSSVNNLNQNVISSYYKSVYTPENLVITAAGNLKHQALVNLAAQEFESLPPVGVAPKSASPQTNASINLRSKKELEQVHLIMGVPCYPVAHEKRFACYLLNTLLGGGMSSRLFQNIRERQGLAYSVYSDLSNYRDTGCLSVYAGTSLESARKVVDSVLKEFQELKQNRVEEEELRRAKDHLKGSLMLSLESTSSRMSNLARQEMYFHQFFTLNELIDRIEDVTADQIRQIAQTFFTQDQIALTVLGNLQDFQITQDELVC